MNRRDLAGYCTVIRPTNSNQEQYELVGYGEDDQPAPDALLRDRGGVIFDTREEAREAIKQTKKICEGDEWLDNWEFGIIEMYKP